MSTSKSGRDLDDLARRIRKIYIRERRLHEERLTRRPSKYLPGPAWDGGTTRDGHKRRNIWKRLAEFMIDERLEAVPNDFIQCVFDKWSPLKAPMPNQLMSVRSLEMYDLAGKRWNANRDEWEALQQFHEKIHLPPGYNRKLQQAVAARKRADEAVRRAAEATRETLADLVNKVGMSLGDAGELLGLSKQRVAQILHEAKNKQ